MEDGTEGGRTGDEDEPLNRETEGGPQEADDDAADEDNDADDDGVTRLL